MDYVAPIGGAANESYVDANTQSKIRGSRPSAKVFEDPQREIVNAITLLGGEPDAENLNQLGTQIITKMNELIAGELTTTTIDNETFAANLATHDMVRLTLKGVVTFTAPPSGFGGFVGVLVNDGAVGIDYSAFSLKTVEFNGSSGAKHIIAIVRDGVDTIIKIEEITADA